MEVPTTPLIEQDLQIQEKSCNALLPKFAENNSVNMDIQNENKTVVENTSAEENTTVEENTSVDSNKNKTVNGTADITYEQGQWSPANPEGKKVYTPSFMYALWDSQLAKKKPENLQNSESIFVDESKLKSRPVQRSRISDSPDGTSPANKIFPQVKSRSSGTPNRRSQHGKQSSRGEGRRGDGRNSSNNQGGKGNIEINISLSRDVKLNVAENAWRPTHAKKDGSKGSGDNAALEEMYKRFRSILNKLAPENFDKLINQVRDLKIDNDEKLTAVIDLVFEKAIDEPNYANLYANMCKELEQITVKKSNNNGNETLVNFRQLLVTRCKNEFEKKTIEERLTSKRMEEINRCTDPEEKKRMQLSFEEEERKERLRSVGNVRFIGELFKKRYINPNIMKICINHLINKIEEETMECLCKLLTTIGRDLEVSAKVDLQEYFTKIKKIENDKTNKLNSRIRFMIKDVCELRSNSWVPRQELNAVKKMDADHMEADNRKNSHLKHSTSMNQSYRDDQMYSGRNAGSRSVNEESGWSSVPQRGRQKQPYVDSSKLKALTTPVAETQLTPPTGMMWGKGSQSIKKESNQNNKSSSAQPNQRKISTLTNNPFDALMMEDPVNSEPPNREPKKPELPVQKPILLKSISIAEMLNDFVKSTDDPRTELLKSLQTEMPKSELPKAVKAIIEASVKFTCKQAQITGKVVGDLVAKKHLSCEKFLDTFRRSLEDLKKSYEDSDFWDRISNFFWGFSSCYELKFSQLLKAAKPVIEEKMGFNLLMALFMEKIEDSNEVDLVKRLWIESDVALTDWMSFEDAQEFPKCISCEFLTCPVKEESTPESLCEQILQNMRKGMPLEELKTWIEFNVGESNLKESWFIRGLTKAVYTFAMCLPEYPTPRFDKSKWKVYYQLLIDYVANEPSAEMDCLFGIQCLLTELEHPQGIALSLFEDLYESGEAVSTDAFLKWEEDNTQPKGKGVILKELTSFFTLLKSHDDSSDETLPDD